MINTVKYLRYASSVCPHGRKPITWKIADVELLRTLDIIVAVRSKFGRGARRYLYLHLDRVNNKVWLLHDHKDLTVTSPSRTLVGVNGEFVTP